MSGLTVFIYFGGEWDDSSNYIDYSVRGVILPLDCSHDMLVRLVAGVVDKEYCGTNFMLEYQHFNQGPRIPINDDASLRFYMEFKKGEIYRRSFPICVSVLPPREGGNDDNAELVTGCTNDIPQAFTEQNINETDALTFINPTVEEMGMELSNYIECPRERLEDSLCDIISTPNIEEVKKNSLFKSKELLVASISLLALNKKFQYSVVKSDNKFYWLKCVNNNCNWSFKASRSGLSGNFKVRQINNVHSCSMESGLGDHRQATSFVIATSIKHKFISSRRIYTPGDIIDDMQHTYGVTVSYDKAWRARESAIKMIRGDPNESYGNLPAYMHRLEEANPGSFTRIETDVEGRFLFSFVALGGSIAGWKYCKPVIVVDGTFLTSRYRGTLFTACTQDANNNIFILAFGVGDTENNNAWEWFMTRLKEAYNDRDGLCIVSDRHGSIAHAVDTVFPDALHGACTYHLLKNLKKEFPKTGKAMRLPFNLASRAYTTKEFETQMGKLDDIDEGVRLYLKNVGFERWSRAHMTTDRYSTMTSNIAESVNSAIKYAKKYPIEALFECLRCTIQKWFYQNLSDAKSTFTRMASRHDSMLKERINMSRRLRVHPSSDTLYQVIEDNSSYVVDMENKSCSCRHFQLDHIPCPHAVAVIAMRNYSPSEYCSKYFSKESYLYAYRIPICPLGNKEDWNIPWEVKERIVLAPIPKRGPGRPKETRFRSCVEYKKRTRCGKCDAYGHNSRTCPNPNLDSGQNMCKRKRCNRQSRMVEDHHTSERADEEY